MNELDRHLDVYEDNQFGYPRRVPIDQSSNLKLPCKNRPTVKAGDLVSWYRGDTWFAQRFGRNPVGLVLDSRWMLVDWDDKGTTSDFRRWSYMPEAAILWSNGELTNSSHGALKRIGTSR